MINTSVGALLMAALTMVSAQEPVDRFQKVGNEIGQVYSSIGGVLAEGNNLDGAELARAAQDGDRAVASLRGEIRTMDWSHLGPQAAKAQNENLEAYLNNLDVENGRLHAMATAAANNAVNNQYNAQRDRQGQQAQYAPGSPGNSGYQPAQQQQYNPQYFNGQDARVNGRPKAYINHAVATGARNKAVVKDEATTTLSSATSESTDINSKESKSESKEASRESKSESKSASRESKSESKSESRQSKSDSKEASATATKASDSTATSTNDASSTSTESHSGKHSKNGASHVTLAGSFAGFAAFILALL